MMLCKAYLLEENLHVTQKDTIDQEPDEKNQLQTMKEKKKKWLTSPLLAVSLKMEHLICESNF